MRRLLVYLLMSVSIPAAGCNSAGFPPGILFWEKQDVADFELPHQKIERYEALAASARRKSPEEQEQIAQQLALEIRDTQDPILRTHIVKALSQIPAPTSQKVLNAALSDEDEFVRLTAVRGLVKRGTDDDIRVLARVVESEKDLAVRLAAIRGLGTLKSPATVQALAVALDDPNPAVVSSTIDSLQASTGRYYGRDAKAWAEFARGVDVPQKERTLAERLRSWWE